MPVTKSAAKALRRDQRRAKVNRRIRGQLKTAVKEAEEKKTKKALVRVYSVLDRAAKKKVIHTNKAGRLKSRLAKLMEQKKEKKTAQSSGKRKVRRKRKASN